MSSPVLRGLLKAWTEDPKGRALLAGWAAVATGVTIRAVYVRRKARRAAAAAAQDNTATTTTTVAATPSHAPDTPAKPATSSFRAVLSLAVPGWRSKPAGWCALLTVGIGLRLLVQVRTSAEIGALGSLLAKRDWPVLYRRMLTYGLMAIPAALTAALQKFAVSNMALSMRANLTAHLHERYAAADSLPASLAAVEGGESEDGGVLRGTADVAAYCSEAVSLYEAVLKPTVEVVLLSGKLASMMGTTQLLQCYAFFAVAGSWTRLVAPSFATLASDVQAADGALLSHRSRLHAYAEEVAMLQGLQAETSYMDSAAENAHATSARLYAQRFVSDVLDNYVLRYVGILAAFTAMLPAVVSGVASHASSEDPTKYFLTCLHLLVQVGMALKDLVVSRKVVATARGLASRVHALLTALELKLEAPAPLAAEEARTEAAVNAQLKMGNASISPMKGSMEIIDRNPVAASETGAALLYVRGARIETPTADVLLNSLTFTFRERQRVLVTGPNGAGKSSFVRVLAGVWTAKAGEVSWCVPPSEVFVLPQRPYVLPHLTLRQNLVYPAVDGAGVAAAAVSDDRLLALLAKVGLERLAPEGAASLHAANCDGLSPGERQRLGLGRMLLADPKVVVLDEPCAAVEPEFECRFFAELASSNVSVITVAHRAEVAAYHTHELRLDGAGGASFLPLSPPLAKGSDSSSSGEILS